jgi:hypothetical protein
LLFDVNLGILFLTLSIKPNIVQVSSSDAPLLTTDAEASTAETTSLSTSHGSSTEPKQTTTKQIIDVGSLSKHLFLFVHSTQNNIFFLENDPRVKRVLFSQNK